MVYPRTLLSVYPNKFGFKLCIDEGSTDHFI